ncbi:hypothetical protein GLW05_09775 [Pontibacillus yanchengensis]|uniref:Lipoprotein n=1 Tax=Pontibacillus yanchengensis TaxID=462910 RepID=A0A6I4ZZL5_9BACI|nr:PCYCGC motif-containing (lipo)protein [Pontibacillus yanchengensis]MYL33887.1 hypothetical protein [Pontibacillus yanchengensis]
MKKLFLIGMLLLSAVAAGCSSDHINEAEHTSMGDIREETSDASTLPGFLDDKPEDMQVLYTAVAQHKELLEQMPCYCGCGDSVGHKNNYDCFIHDEGGNREVVWDSHATKCGVCLEIAAKSILDKRDGKSAKDIRQNIDKIYQNGYGEPTPTPDI